MDFLVYSRAAPGAASSRDDPALDEAHWAYMDRFADGMIARGPTLGPDRATWTGSIHILDLPSVAAAHEFAEREPYNREGLFDRHLIRRFRNLLGRTMWEFPGEADDPRFFVVAQARGDLSELPGLAIPAPERLIVHGELQTLDEGKAVGVALALQAPTRQAVERLLRDGQAAPAEQLDIQIFDWEFGGRR